MAEEPTFFATPAHFRRWLQKNHRSETVLWVGYYKKGTGRPSITWPESVDEALCFGWIDGVRKTCGADSYMIRFSPRREGSIWSLVNIRKAEELIRTKRMKAAGLRAFEARDPERSGIYSFEREHARLTAEDQKRFRSNRKAWGFFQSQPPGYRKLMIFWVTSAKREETRAKRLQRLIGESAAGRRIT